MLRLASLTAITLLTATVAQAAPLGCLPITMSPNEAARVTIPRASFKLSDSGAAFSETTRNALNAPLQGKALGGVSGVNVFRAVTPEQIARLHAKAYLGAEGWRAAFDGEDGLRSLGDDRWVGLYTDGKADILLRVEPSPGWPRTDMPGSTQDKAKLRELASRGEAAVYRFEGRGIAKAACDGDLPLAVGASS